MMKTPVGEQVGRRREGQPGLAQAAQVHRGQQRRRTPTAIRTRRWCSDGTAEMMLSTPDETDTATVIT